MHQSLRYNDASISQGLYAYNLYICVYIYGYIYTHTRAILHVCNSIDNIIIYKYIVILCIIILLHIMINDIDR